MENIYNIISVYSHSPESMEKIVDRATVLNENLGFVFGNKTCSMIVIKSDLSAESIKNKLMNDMSNVEVIVLKMSFKELSACVDASRSSMIKEAFENV
jgi:hypothetical protein